jgi:hypothetical protein
MANHDDSYKLLFSHAAMVADLIRGFVREDWVSGLDLSTLEKVGGHYVSNDLRHRESDMVWRVRWGGERWLYVYLLLEFQSTVDPYMAVRLMTYVGLMYEDLIRQRALPSSGRLPPVLPLVLYNGYVRWGAALDVAELVEELPAGLERYQPRLQYFLLDEGRLAQQDLESRNLAAALFQLEQSSSPQDIERVVVALLEWLKGEGDLQRAFAVWLVRVLLPARLPGIEIPGLMDLQEIKSMLAERVMEWTHQWEQSGVEKARKEDLAAVRKVLVQQLMARFGPLPEGAQKRLEAIGSLESLAKLLAQVPQAPSLAVLGLA